MKKIDPVVLLLLVTCAACGLLLWLDHRSEVDTAANSQLSSGADIGTSEPLRSVKRLPEEDPPETSALPKTTNTPTVAVSRSDASTTNTSTTSASKANATSETANVPATSQTMLKITRDVPVRVTGLTQKSSTLYVAVFDSAAGFPKSERSQVTTTVPIDAEKVEFSLSLPVNQAAAMAVFQDLDGDGKLSKNGFGLPVEPYGFSNNARGLLGPPSFGQATIIITEDRDGSEYLEIQVK